jgi:hypothetical protein
MSPHEDGEKIRHARIYSPFRTMSSLVAAFVLSLVLAGLDPSNLVLSRRPVGPSARRPVGPSARRRAASPAVLPSASPTEVQPVGHRFNDGTR